MNKLFLGVLAATSAMLPISANAALTTYIGADDNVGSLAQMTNSAAAASAFGAATAGASLIDFESAVPLDVNISGGSVTSNSGCGALCGFNTTSGGQNFLLLVGGSTTFSFTNAVNAFGFFISGLQTNLVGQQTVTFSDGSLQTIDFPAAVQGGNGGGGAFIGFTDFGKSISSVTVNVNGDIVAIDDVKFGFLGNAVPEPGTWAMMLAGFGAIGFAMRRRRSVAVSFA